MNRVLEEVTERLSIFKDMYSYIRIVEPIEKRTHAQLDVGENSPAYEPCYNFWDTDKHCENCISMRALNNQKSAVKIEIKDDHTFLIQAFHVSFEDKSYIVEMLKDITEEQIIMSEKSEKVDLHQYVKNLNSKLIIDDLTGIYNRRYVEERLPADMHSARVKNQSVTVVMADIDHFKKLNDTYGHLAGDNVLVEFADLLKNSIRETTDWVARFGGEEFLIVLNGVDRKAAWAIVEKIRQKIEGHVFEFDQKKIQLTCSFGVHVVQDEACDVQTVIGPADECLYLAKEKGRNCAVLK